MHILSSQNVYGRAEGIADYYRPWAVFFKSSSLPPQQIHPLRPFNMHPAAKVLHYAPELYEGMKAYRGVEDGVIRLFRPELNMKRMNSSASRACLPNFDGDELTKLIAKLGEARNGDEPN